MILYMIDIFFAHQKPELKVAVITINSSKLDTLEGVVANRIYNLI